MTLLEQSIHQGSLAVVDMGYDRQVTNVAVGIGFHIAPKLSHLETPDIE